MQVRSLRARRYTSSEKSLSVSYPDPVYGTLYLKFRIMFSFRIIDPVRFFKRTGRDTSVYSFMGSSAIPKMPFLEVLDHMEEALNLCATRDKMPFVQLISNKSKVKDAVNQALAKVWLEQRGMVIESIALTGLTLDAASRKRVEQFDSAKLFADDPDALKTLVALGLTDAMKAAASNPAGAVTGFAGMGMAGTLSGNMQAVPPNVFGQSITEPETCPFCGTPVPSQRPLEYCPACNADIRSYFS